ncbi:uncharacterized protein FTOL_08307 [Fusarium torulosum]|uniref:Uncharacterized protein n=1 Tax=Fusarium torulosum TaxID=33205 RepID=A0AAE8MCC2_9HYPO|nr:uncharacterized protein FTOL_08307 [Fusarium torulosum]
MTVSDVIKIGNVATPIENKPGPDVKDIVGEFIFVKPNLTKSFFSTFDKDSKRQVSEKPDINQYKYLSHFRKINTKGIEEMSWPVAGKDYVGLCSLHSWTYTVLPPGQLNIYDAFVHLAKELNVLRPLGRVFEPLVSSSDKVSTRLGTRIKDDYSLVKYRVQTGEKPVALYRGPFTPTRVARHDQPNQCSNSGQDFQILDKDVGLMDISYSVAWQIGRTLALGDRAYIAAFSSLRSIIRRKEITDSKINAVAKTGPSHNRYRSKDDVLESLQDTIERLQHIQYPSPPDSDDDGDAEFSPGGAQKRCYRPQLSKKEYPKLSFASNLVQDTSQDRAEQAVKEFSMGKDGTIKLIVPKFPLTGLICDRILSLCIQTSERQPKEMILVTYPFFTTLLWQMSGSITVLSGQTSSINAVGCNGKRDLLPFHELTAYASADNSEPKGRGQKARSTIIKQSPKRRKSAKSARREPNPEVESMDLTYPEEGNINENLSEQEQSDKPRSAHDGDQS